MKTLSPVARRLLKSLAALVLFNYANAGAQTQQEHVHNMSHSVMPFDMAKTVHIFKMTDSGGVLRVIVKDKSYADQVGLIQQHLGAEAARFRRGDYGDAATLHGADMPGLRELELGARSVKVSYFILPDGAEIRWVTADAHLRTAIHRWFGAQLSEHGADARAE